MTIKEIETLSGMTRANIRFYEKEGLITPQRNPNGYRNYSEEDLETLKRIRLLRSIHVSLEDIKLLNQNKCELSDLLLAHLRTLKSEQQDQERSRLICEQLCRSQVSYDSFDAQHYLDLLNDDASARQVLAELEKDSIPKVTAPWRRFFARMIDMTIYMTLWDAFLSLFFHINIMETGLPGMVMDIIASAVLLLLAEPVMLALSGTTPGKFLFGLRVSAESGARLTWKEAWRRTWIVWRKGYGYYIPVYQIIREYRSYRSCKKGELLEWEEDSVLWLDGSHLRLKAAAAVGVLIILTGVTFTIWQAGALPCNRGEITAAQYVENFNDMQRFYQIDRQLNLPEFDPIIDGDYRRMLNEDGTWEKIPGNFYMNNTAGHYPDLPQLHYEETDGIMTGLEFSAEYENEDVEITPYGDLMALAALSYICAQDDYSLLSDPPSFLYLRIKANADRFYDFTISEAGITVEVSFEYNGYELRQAEYSSSFVLVPLYGEDPYFHVSYRVYCGD